MFDIYIVTFNRLLYLQKCIWSILASTPGKYRIIIIDDGSTDGTREWILKEEAKKRLPISHIFPAAKLGSANAFNMVINSGKGEWFCFCNDDIWFHRGWLENGMAITKTFLDCGFVTLYNFTALRKTLIETILTNKIPCGGVNLVTLSGLSATIMYRPLWLASGGFRLPRGRNMGFFATPFCQNIIKNVDLKRKKLYMPMIAQAYNMDFMASPLQEREALEEYCKMRKKLKGD